MDDSKRKPGRKSPARVGPATGNEQQLPFPEAVAEALGAASGHRRPAIDELEDRETGSPGRKERRP
jgi:hypothetical protein